MIFFVANIYFITFLKIFILANFIFLSRQIYIYIYKILLLQKTYFNRAEFTSSKISKRIQNAIVQHHTSSTTDLSGRVCYFN